MLRVSSLLVATALALAFFAPGLAPTVAADDCSFDCAGCDVAAGPMRFDGSCFVGGTTYGADTCLLAYTLCGAPMVFCHFSVGHGSPVPDCQGYAPPLPSECVSYWRGPDRGVCVDPARADCKAWHYTHNDELCVAPIPA
ncbi:MAG: hypothetical protein ACPGQL_09740 [Thermoplasmatota archaeon]